MMKKILIFLIVLGALTFINIDLFANSYQGITLDTQITALNNLTLNEVFNDNNDYDPFFGSSSATVNGITRDTGYTIRLFGTSTGTSEQPISQYIDIDGEYYINGLGRNDNNSNTRFIIWTNNSSTALAYSSNGQSLRFVFNSTSQNNFRLWYNVLSNNTIDMYATPHIINLTALGIEQTTTSNLDYYFDIYLALKNGINLDVYYNEGNNVGFDNGYDTGYLAGYNQGETQGLIDGYDNGYNEGMDYAATNNITLLSVFSMIIGVVMSMLGFIINIEMFGISIASVLGTLAIGVSIIWLLKLIRG